MELVDMAQKKEFKASQNLEQERLEFLENERGKDAALSFAEQTRRTYRRAILSRSPPAGDAVFRLRLLASYCYLKRYIEKS
ncbi:hypothetical protein [Aliidiomarina quisquiliarum]|uniref:hypothetical protein n=1 Tax=Aliidiomarina quisquiliarum TaxID=2938947 RepID=UPI00208DE5FC|nr:hypothetical protein [Aliidiomarina quisquiliarum]MCO4321599.1 hypothetical protein [Aliidiomarina quisquiliarum]